MREAEFYTANTDGSLSCLLCPQGCRIAKGQAGLCGVRRHEHGLLLAESYGAVTSLALDPIEKKPLARFHPGSHILSLGSYGCNLRCPFCQNHHISMGKAPYRSLTPQDIAAASRELSSQGNIGVAYTYNEPLIGYEFVMDTAHLIHAQVQKNVLVSNGYIEEGPLARLLPLIDALNIDLKGFSDAFYNRLGGKLEPVKRSIKLAAAACHVEVTTLIIAGHNDSATEMRQLCQWLGGISPEIPLHISRFFPAYRWQHLPPTPVDTVYSLAEIARQYLRHVYTGNC